MIFSDIMRYLTPISFKRIFNKFLGTYRAPIWFYIKIFIDSDNNIHKCFIDNEMIYSSDVNLDLMKQISKKLKLHLENKPVNWIEYCKIEPICDYLKDMKLDVHIDDTNKNLIIITVNGKLSEKELKKQIKNKK